MRQNKRKPRVPYTTYESKIANRRIELGLTQTKLAELIGTNRTSITNIEAGKNLPRVDDLKQWMRALKWDANTLLKALGV